LSSFALCYMHYAYHEVYSRWLSDFQWDKYNFSATTFFQIVNQVWALKLRTLNIKHGRNSNHRSKTLGISLPFNRPQNLKSYSKHVLDVKCQCVDFPVRISLINTYIDKQPASKSVMWAATCSKSACMFSVTVRV
jgi:hypothetical protein